MGEHPLGETPPSYIQTFFSSRTTNMSDRSSSSNSSISSDSSSSSSSSKAKKFAYASGNCKVLSRWLITGLKEKEVKKAREAFQPNFRKKENLLSNPILDDAFYLRLKSAKRSTASKANIDTRKKEYRKLSFKILDLAKPLLFLNERTRQRRVYNSDVKAVQTALKLWVSLIRDVLFIRRHNILSQSYPGFLHLLDDPNHFKGGEHLFGPQFLNRLVAEAKVQSTLVDIESQGAPKEPANSRESSEGHKGYNLLLLAFSSCFLGIG